MHGSRVYLHALTDELKLAGVLAPDVDVASVDELLGVLEREIGGTARLIDVPPLELAELRLEAAPHRGLRRLRAPRVGSVRAGGRRPLRPRAADVDGEDRGPRLAGCLSTWYDLQQ
jgi:hypothetical protein